jgi:hypothetical protein
VQNEQANCEYPEAEDTWSHHAAQYSLADQGLAQIVPSPVAVCPVQILILAFLYARFATNDRAALPGTVAAF